MTVSGMARYTGPDLRNNWASTVDNLLYQVFAVGESSVILLHPPPVPLVGVSTGINRGCRQNDRPLADGCRGFVPWHRICCFLLHPPLYL